jgi:hypothetical protein
MITTHDDHNRPGRSTLLGDRNRHRDRTTKARLSFPPGGPRVPALTARAQISLCVPIAA